MTTLQWTAYFHALLTLKHNFAFRENSLTLANLTSLVWLTLLPASAEAVDADTGPTKRIEKFIIPELINNYEHNATLEQVPPPDYDKQLSNMKARAIKMYFESLFGIYQVPVLENTASEAERQAHRHRTSPYFMSGTYVSVGQDVTLQVGSPPTTTVNCSAFTIDNFDKAYKPDELNPQSLKADSTQTYHATQKGMIAFSCTDSDRHMNNWENLYKSVQITVHNPSRALKKFPPFILGLNSPSDWKVFASNPNPSGHVFAFNGQTMVDFSAAQAAAIADKDISNLLSGVPTHIIPSMACSTFMGLQKRLCVGIICGRLFKHRSKN